MIRIIRIAAALMIAAAATGCGASKSGGQLAPRAPLGSAATTAAAAQIDGVDPATAPTYRLGPGEAIEVFVWRAPELGFRGPIRPDGRFSMPLIEDMAAAGKSPTELARDIEEKLKAYVQDPIVTVIAQGSAGDPRQQIKIVGQAVSPSSLPYRSGLTVLDVIIAVGGLTEFAAGNRAVLIRNEDGERKSYNLRLDDLVRSGDISADRPLLPGDTIIVPESWL